MSAPKATVAEVMAALEREGRIGPDWQATAEAALAVEADAPPWYVRVMVGFGAWIASLLLIGFVIAPFMRSEAALIGIGAGMIAGAFGLRRLSGHDFAAQSALATSLSGQVVMVMGLGDEVVPALLTIMTCQSVLALMFPDRTHRFLSVLAAVTAAVILNYQQKVAGAIHLLVFGLAAGWLVFHFQEGALMARGLTARLRPVAFGLLVAMLGCVMLSTVYVLPELMGLLSFSFYPYPWISSLGFGALLLALEWRLLGSLEGVTADTRAVLVATSALVVAVSLPAPGIAASLVVLLVGVMFAERLVVGIGFGFFAVFLGAYFYGIETSLLVKSATLTATGLLLLGLRLYLLRRLGKTEEKAHA
jgi:hypothetical protein